MLNHIPIIKNRTEDWAIVHWGRKSPAICRQSSALLENGQSLSEWPLLWLQFRSVIHSKGRMCRKSSLWLDGHADKNMKVKMSRLQAVPSFGHYEGCKFILMNEWTDEWKCFCVYWRSAQRQFIQMYVWTYGNPYKWKSEWLNVWTTERMNRLRAFTWFDERRQFRGDLKSILE